MARPRTPLASHNVLRTTSVDDACAAVATAMVPHRLRAVGQVPFVAQHNAVMLERASLHYIDYGSEVDIVADGLSFYLLQIPLGGRSAITCGGSTLTAAPRRALLTGIGQPVHMRYSAGNARLMLRFDPGLLTERWELARDLGDVTGSPASAVLDLGQGYGRSWLALVDHTYADVEREEGITSACLVRRSIELALVDGLIACLATRTGRAPARSPQERTIARAARIIDEHCAEPIGTPDIAEAVGLSVRSLQDGFRLHLGTTPMAYLRGARLQRARELLASGAVESVTDAALRCGITHLGRFSHDYRAAFGELPRDTLVGA